MSRVGKDYQREKAMTALYSCKKTQDHETYLIAKFNESLVIEASYFVGPKKCQCEGWQKKGTCRHLTMRTMFMMNHHVSDGWFLDFDNRRWREYPNLVIDGTAKDYIEKIDALALGDGGYGSAGQTVPSSAPAVAGGVSLSSPATPEVEGESQSSPPSGVQIFAMDQLPAEGLHKVIAKAVGEDHKTTFSIPRRKL